MIAAPVCRLFMGGLTKARGCPRGRHRQHPRRCLRVVRPVATDSRRRVAPDCPAQPHPACGAARLPESALKRTEPRKRRRNRRRESERSSGQGTIRTGTHASAYCIRSRGGAPLTPAWTTFRALPDHRPTRAHAPRPQGAQAVLRGVDLPIEDDTCGRMVHAGHQRCIHCANWWLLRHALNEVELAITAILEDDTAPCVSHDDTRDHLPAIVPTPRRSHRPRRRRRIADISLEPPCQTVWNDRLAIVPSSCPSTRQGGQGHLRFAG